MKKNLIEAVQRILGSSSYAKYCEHLRKKGGKGGDDKPLTPQEFYLDSLKRRYTGVSRCC